jgi:glucose/mannose-6-phosphate isomerase
MSVLEDIDAIKKIDKDGMYGLIVDFPNQLADSLKISKKVDLKKINPEKIKNIIVAGMGGSAIGGDLVKSYLAEETDLPFFVCKNYTLPQFVSQKSLVFVSSYSGNTEETLSAYQDAKKRKAQIISICSGGKLNELNLEDGIPLVEIPKGFPPRAALGFSFVPIILILSRLKLIKNKENELKKALGFLSKNVNQYRQDAPHKMEKDALENKAKELALRLHHKLPIIYASIDFFDAVAYRWKCQICENSKMLAYSNIFPEFNHNELVGWNILKGLKGKLVVVILRDKDDHPRIKTRIEIVKRILQGRKIEVIEAESHGENLLSRILSLIQLGDFTSFYLAILNKVNPTPVKVIDFLKSELAKE